MEDSSRSPSLPGNLRKNKKVLNTFSTIAQMSLLALLICLLLYMNCQGMATGVNSEKIKVVLSSRSKA